MPDFIGDGVAGAARVVLPAASRCRQWAMFSKAGSAYWQLRAAFDPYLNGYRRQNVL